MVSVEARRKVHDRPSRKGTRGESTSARRKTQAQSFHVVSATCQDAESSQPEQATVTEAASKDEGTRMLAFASLASVADHQAPPAPSVTATSTVAQASWPT